VLFGGQLAIFQRRVEELAGVLLSFPRVAATAMIVEPTPRPDTFPAKPNRPVVITVVASLLDAAGNRHK
jgi:hypothetical protein